MLLRVRAAGICRTDIHLIRNYRRDLEHPVILGHEIAGEVVNIGGDSEVLKPGQIVLANHKLVCGACRPCLHGREALCTKSRVLGIDLDGGFAEYVKTNASRVLPLPPSVSSAAGAALTCGGVTAYHALRSVARIEPYEVVLVLGTGGVGLFAVQIAKNIGAEVIAADVRPDALRKAERLGASRAVHVDASNPASLAEAIGSDAVDVVVDLVGNPEIANSLPPTLRPAGRYVVTSGGLEDRLSTSPFLLFRRELEIKGSRGSSFDELKEVVNLAAQGSLDSSIACQAPLEDGLRLLKEVERGEVVGRAVLVP